MSRKLIPLTLITLISSCAQFETSRSYLSEMEHDDSHYFEANEDFPVMAGDTGKKDYTLDDYIPRVPQSSEDILERKSRSSLKQELHALEDKQNEKNREFYETHKHKLATVSEKIYFLKLPSGERRDYLASRGFLQQNEMVVSRAPASMSMGYRPASLNLGMTKNQVMSSWGKPSRVEVAGNPSYENERWAYSVNGALKYIYFESGTVQGWE